MAKILISSTSEDLVEHRKRLDATFRRMEQDAIGMDYFGAEPGTPVAVCQGKVDEADLVVLVVAHRYGWVPSVEEGGDGVSSITRLEFERARNPPSGLGPKPVLVFAVDEKAEWTARREQDRLVQARSPEEALEIYQAVRALGDFKKELQTLVRDTFSTPADLADRAGSAVSKWLLKRAHVNQEQETAQAALRDVMAKVAGHLEQGLPETALAYLDRAFLEGPAVNRASIADKGLEIASASLSLYDEPLVAFANDVIETGGQLRILALRTLGKCKSQLSRPLWKDGKRDEAWALALEARAHLETAATEDPLDADTFGTLGGLLKRMAACAAVLHPDQVQTLEDAMLKAYERGWSTTPHAYPLLNYLEQRAVLRASREPGVGARPLIAPSEAPLRLALGKATKTREAQLGKSQDRPWAAFDVARGRHYLNQNVPGFLEDLEQAVQEARSVARVPSDRFMVTTTCDSLRALLDANVALEGLEEGIGLLDRAVEHDDWFLSRPQYPTPYLQRELLELRVTLTDALDRQAALTKAHAADVADFIQAMELRWSREDEERFQAGLAEWKKQLEPKDLKILRGLWKLLGSRAVEAVTGGAVDLDAAAALAADLVKGRKQ